MERRSFIGVAIASLFAPFVGSRKAKAPAPWRSRVFVASMCEVFEARTVHIDGDRGSDITGDGSLERPFATFARLAHQPLPDRMLVSGRIYNNSGSTLRAQRTVDSGIWKVESA